MIGYLSHRPERRNLQLAQLIGGQCEVAAQSEGPVGMLAQLEIQESTLIGRQDDAAPPSVLHEVATDQIVAAA